MKKFIISLAISMFVLQVSSCTDFAERLRQHTYPRTFHYITDEQLRSTMWLLAYHSRELRELMASPQGITNHRVEVLQHLQKMEQATIDLNRTGWPTNHPLVDAKRSNFLRDIRTAQEAINHDPPNFLLAGAVSGACVYCHRSQ